MSNDDTTQEEEILQEEPITEPNDDPLDLITDPDELRAEAKKHRSIAQRAKKPEVKVETETKATKLPEDVVTKGDMARIATRQAKDLVSDEIREVYDDLIKIPLGGFDSLDPKSIAQNLEERFKIYSARNPKKEKNDSAKVLSETKAQGTGQAKATETKSSLNVKLPTPPSEWYKQPE